MKRFAEILSPFLHFHTVYYIKPNKLLYHSQKTTSDILGENWGQAQELGAKNKLFRVKIAYERSKMFNKF